MVMRDPAHRARRLQEGTPIGGVMGGGLGGAGVSVRVWGRAGSDCEGGMVRGLGLRYLKNVVVSMLRCWHTLPPTHARTGPFLRIHLPPHLCNHQRR